MQIGGMWFLLRAARHGADRVAERLEETIQAHAGWVHDHPVPIRARLIEFGTEGERGPPA